MRKSHLQKGSKKKKKKVKKHWDLIKIILTLPELFTV